MATVIRNYDKNGELVSIRVKVYKGKDANGKELSPYTKTIKIPTELNKNQIEKFINKEAVLFEENCKGNMSGKNPNIRFRDFAEEVMRIKENEGLEISTLARYRDMLDSRILDEFGHMKVKDINKNLLNNFYRKLRQPGENKRNKNKGLSSKTIREHHNLLSGIFTEAVNQRIISFNPANEANPPTIIQKPANYFQPEDLQKIKAAFNQEPIKWRTLGYLMMLYGGRRGEYLGLKRKDIDFKRHQITISSCVLYRRNVGVYEKEYPKNKKIRVLPMNNEIEELLKLYLQWLDKEIDAYGDLWTPSDYIFTASSGGLMHPDTVTAHFTRMTDKYRKDDKDFPHINSHAFRHTVASFLLSNGTDLVTTADYIGDKPATVSTTYAHVINKAKTQAFNIMGELVLA